MSGAASPAASQSQLVEVLEFGKFCVTEGGPIEPNAEYRVLGHSPGFPTEMIDVCTPQQLSLGANMVEIERFQLLTLRPHGTVIRPVPLGRNVFYICYRLGQRREGGTRAYMLGRYLCSRTPLHPLMFFRAMEGLRGITRNQASTLTPIGVECGPSDQGHADGLVERARAGLRMKRPVYAMLDDERAFFSLAEQLWVRLDASQQALFSCGWNVSPSLGQTLVLCYGPKIPIHAARLDPIKTPAPGDAAPTASADPFPNRTLPELLAAGRVLLARGPQLPNPLKGFEDAVFAESFAGHSWDQELIYAMPALLDSPLGKFEEELVRHLTRFDGPLQQALYDRVASRLDRTDVLRAFARLVAACRKQNAAWGAGCSQAIDLALRLQVPTRDGNLGSFLVGVDRDDWKRLDAFDTLARKACDQIARLSPNEQITIHETLLRGSQPRWYESWLRMDGRDVIYLMLKAARPLALNTIRTIVEPHADALCAVAYAIASDAPIGADEIARIAQLDAAIQDEVAACVYARWLAGERTFTPWQDWFASRLPPSLLKHALAGWASNSDVILTDVGREFEQQASHRVALVHHLTALCDDGDRQPPRGLGDACWDRYLGVEPDGTSVHDGTSSWTGTAASRLRFRLALRKGDAPKVVDSLVAAWSFGGLSQLPAECSGQARSVFDRLVGDEASDAAFDRLVARWPEWPPLADWVVADGFRVGAWLLQRADLDPALFRMFTARCTPDVSFILAALYRLRSPDGIPLAPPPSDTPENVRQHLQPASLTGARLAAYLEHLWNPADATWRVVAAWAQWTKSAAFTNEVLRMLTGLPFQGRMISSTRAWNALAVTTNRHMPADLLLVQSVLTGSFGGQTRPTEPAWADAIAIVGSDDKMMECGQWDALWRDADCAWKRLFVLQSTPQRVYALSTVDLALLREEPAWLTFAVSARETWRRDHGVDDDSHELLARLTVAAASFQQFTFGDSRWRVEFDGSPLMGAFRGVPTRQYADGLFLETLECFHPGLRTKRWCRDVGSNLVRFVAAFERGTVDYREALALVDLTFFHKYVYSAPILTSRGITPADFRALLAKERQLTTDDGLLHRVRHFVASPEIEWRHLPRFVAVDANVILVDIGLRDLIELMLNAPTTENSL